MIAGQQISPNPKSPGLSSVSQSGIRPRTPIRGGGRQLQFWDTAEAAFDRLRQWPRWLLILTAVLFTTVVAWLDHLTGDDIPLILLYLPVVAGVCWTINLAAAVSTSLICSGLWLFDDLVIEGSPAREAWHYWATAVHFVFFVVVATVLTRLRVAHQREELHSRVDSLTDLPNSRAFEEYSEREIARSARTHKPLTVALLDCDNFKLVNDGFGHSVGDDLLCEAALALSRGLRPSDIAARIGGDEFTILLPETSSEIARMVLSRVKVGLDQAMEARGWPVTFSIGAITFDEPPTSANAMIREVDREMYAVKRSGKNGLTLRHVEKKAERPSVVQQEFVGV